MFRSVQLEGFPDVTEVEEAVRILADVLGAYLSAHLDRTEVGRSEAEQWMHIAAGNFLETYNACLTPARRDRRAVGAFRDEMKRSLGQAFIGIAAYCICKNYDIGDVLIAGLEVYEDARVERYGTSVRDRLRRALVRDAHNIVNQGSYRSKLLKQEEMTE